MTIKVLVLFSGTGSLEKGLERMKVELDIEYRGLDILDKHKPYYNVDILEWDYKTEFQTWCPDYIHSSFVCCEFSALKVGRVRNTDLGFALLNKSLEIYDYVKTLNPNVIITLENPRSKFTREHDGLNTLNRVLTSYCKYGFGYQKPTYIWSNKEIELEHCTGVDKCSFKKEHNYHRVRIGYVDTVRYPLQIIDSKHYREQKILGNIPKNFNATDFRYRIPDELIDDILNQVLFD